MLPMLMCTGIVDNVLHQAGGVGRDGKPYPASWRVQLKCDQPLEEGGVRRKFVELRTDHPDYFRALEGKPVTLPVGTSNGSKGEPNFYLPKGWIPPAIVTHQDTLRGEPA